nr:lipid droplet localized protein-like isoform X2 [Cherax quadricarinatus]
MFQACRTLIKPLQSGQILKMATVAEGQRYDFVVFGATGYTGQYVVEEVSRVAHHDWTERNIPLTWAVAGRSKDKLLNSLATARKETGLNLENVAVILADVADQDSLNRMAAQSTVVINCVGPYQVYGERVVRACIENGSNHVDISGEPQVIFHEGLPIYSLASFWELYFASIYL